MSNQIIIRGKLAKQIYEQILKQDRGMSIHNKGDEKKPVSVVEGWE